MSCSAECMSSAAVAAFRVVQLLFHGTWFARHKQYVPPVCTCCSFVSVNHSRNLLDDNVLSLIK